MTSTPAHADTLSPNQLQRRDQIVQATRELLAHEGIASCTERRVAAAAGLTKSAVHYYFDDLDGLIALAMTAHVEAFVAQLREAVATAPPGRMLTRLVDAYLDVFEERPGVAQLWFEFWITTSRSGRLAELVAIEDRMIDLLHDAIQADRSDGSRQAGSPHRQPRQRRRRDGARAVYTLLLGLIVDETVRPRRSRREVQALVAAVLTPTSATR